MRRRPITSAFSRWSPAFVAACVTFAAAPELFAQTPTELRREREKRADRERDKRATIGADPATMGVPLRGQSVRNRRQPGFVPKGKMFGSMLTLPYASVSQYYDSNIYRADERKIDDGVTTLNAGSEFFSTEGVNLFQARIDVEGGVFTNRRDENYLDARADAALRFNLSPRSSVTPFLTAARSHEDRGDPDATASRDPIVFHVGQIGVDSQWRAGPGFFEFDANASVIGYDDGTRLNGAVSEQSRRSRTEYRVRGRAGIAPTAIAGPFVEADLVAIDMFEDRDVSDRDRNSYGGGAGVGARFDLEGVVIGEAMVGFAYRAVDDDAFPDAVLQPSAKLSLLWNPTPLTSIEVLGRRFLSETVRSPAAVALNSQVEATATHELLRNLRVRVTGTYGHGAFPPSDQFFDYYAGSTGLEYVVDQFWRFDMEYGYENRDSSLPLADFRRHRFGASATLRY